MKTVILDNGHGKEDLSNSSPIWPDGSQFFEWEFTRDIVRLITEKLDIEKIPYKILVPESESISLQERCRRANKIYEEENYQAFLVSIHANAAKGTGWECFTTIGVTKSDAIATIFCEEAEKEFHDKTMRFDYSDGDPDKEKQFYIIKYTKCPAIITENFFMDTENDCKFIMSTQGRERVANMHVAAIKRILAL